MSAAAAAAALSFSAASLFFSAAAALRSLSCSSASHWVWSSPASASDEPVPGPMIRAEGSSSGFEITSGRIESIAQLLPMAAAAYPCISGRTSSGASVSHFAPARAPSGQLPMSRLATLLFLGRQSVRTPISASSANTDWL